ncbi:MAG TPA: hypothetical protein DEP45_04775 [Armatimonadetes bacterium]|mgnify:CR=1 FL=1|nr:hypothetical protein [Armatimonadota bacterium]
MSEPSVVEDRRRPGCLRRGLSTLALICALIPFAIWLFMRVPGEDWWLTAGIVYAPKPQWVAIPGLGVLLALTAWRGRLVLLTTAATLFALFAIAGFEWEQPIKPPPDRLVIRVATWNVFGWTEQRELVRERIMSWDCDIVCLQEAARQTFQKLLPGYQSAMGGDLRIYVRGRITHREAPPDPVTGRRRILIVDAETDAGPLRVIGVHVPRATTHGGTPRELEPLRRYIEEGVELRERKFAELVEELPSEGPFVVAGDMNTPPASRFHAMLSASLIDSFEAVGRGFGHTFVWRRHLPMMRIDYVWAGGGVEPLSHRIEPHRPSDHRPVVVDLALPEQPPG